MNMALNAQILCAVGLFAVVSSVSGNLPVVQADYDSAMNLIESIYNKTVAQSDTAWNYTQQIRNDIFNLQRTSTQAITNYAHKINKKVVEMFNYAINGSLYDCHSSLISDQNELRDNAAQMKSCISLHSKKATEIVTSLNSDIQRYSEEVYELYEMLRLIHKQAYFKNPSRQVTFKSYNDSVIAISETIESIFEKLADGWMMEQLHSSIAACKNPKSLEIIADRIRNNMDEVKKCIVQRAESAASKAV